MASVAKAPSKRHSDRWIARVFVGRDATGRPVQRTKVLYGSKRAVEREAAELERNLRGPGGARVVPARATRATVAELLTEWRDWNVELGRWNPLTVRDHTSRVKLLTREIGTVKLTSLDRKTVEDVVRRWRRQGLSDSAVRSRISALRAACRWGVEEGWLATVPFSAARIGATKVPRRTKVPEMDEIRRVIDAARNAGDLRAAAGLRLVVVTGMRAAEIAGLRWDGIDVDSGRVHVAGQASQHGRGYRLGTKYRGTEGRIITVDPSTIAGLVEYRDSLSLPMDWVLGADGDPLPPDARWLTRRWRRYAEAAGVPAGRKDGYVLHDLRHAAASHALDAGIPVTAVAARLGQSPAVTLSVYAQAIRGAERYAGDALASRLDGG